MVNKRVKISSIVENQLPAFIREDFPLLPEFLSQYYISLENQGGVNDFLQNIDQYIKIDELTNLVETVFLEDDVDYQSETITVSSTSGFPDSYGLIKINSEIITYTSKNDFQFLGCIRGFSGVTSYRSTNVPDQLVFSQSEIDQHSIGSTVYNLSILFLKEFYQKVKKQFSPGFESRSFSSDLNENVFVKQSQDFYATKGTDESFRILFNALYGEPCEVIKPKEYLFNPSNARYQTSEKIVVEPILGNPLDLINLTIKQDETEDFKQAIGVVNDVEKILKGNKEYYILSLDYNYENDYSSVFGKFSVHPKTRTLKAFTTNDTIIDVDSTIGFPKSGNLKTVLSDGTEVSIFYADKNVNQFIDCTIGSDISSGQELRLDAYAYYSDPRNSSDEIRFRICSILSGLDVIDENYFYSPGDTAKINSLGNASNNLRDNNWLFNVSTTYDVKSAEKVDLSNFSYKITTYDENIFIIGDSISLILVDGTEILGTISSINNKKSFVVSNVGDVNIAKIVKVRRNISKTNSFNFGNLNNYISNVQNVYTDYASTIVASNSLPDYANLEVTDRSSYINGTFDGTDITTTDVFGKITPHGFDTGDAVYYTYASENSKLNISSGIYFVKKINLTTIRLSRSRINIFLNKYISVSGTVTDNKLQVVDFYNKNVNPQKILRKISTPINDSGNYETEPGHTGILVNGVEILNYKTTDFVKYGSIDNIEILSEGKNYDVINPPQLIITDSIGVGATGHCEIEGYLDRVDVIDPGFDYIEEPIISISGGNGYGAYAKANLITFQHAVDFNSSPEANVVDLSNNTIAFSTYHKFRDAEEVIYDTYGQNGISGLSTLSRYYVSVKDNYTVGVHTNFTDASVGINTVDLLGYGVGNHKFISKTVKRKIGSVSVLKSGSLYRNRRIVVGQSGINTASNTIIAENHRYLDGDIISYSHSGTPVSGLSTSLYYVSKVSDDEFKLSPVGVGSTNKDFYYATGQYANLISKGTGDHIFNHEPISITVRGNTGVSTVTNVNTSAILQPVFRGSVKSVFVNNGGVGYGSSEIINHDRQPSLTLSTGQKAEVVPIISGYSISQVIVKNSGSGYVQIPDLVISGYGEGAVLTPIVQNGSLVEVKVINGGIGYVEGSTDIAVVPRDERCSLRANIKSWNVNLFEKLLQSEKISLDDGVISTALDRDSGLQYSHLYSPRQLRQKILSARIVAGELVYSPDLRIVNNKEFTSTSHSPIIGWAYDGNPIYGPYGYSGADAKGIIREMVSGYELVKSSEVSSSRPSQSVFPLGFFTEDYIYKGSGDLDEYNGRFCITPEYPNGVYAYFSTIEKTVESSGPFANFKKPSFPYFIGNKYKSIPIGFNFEVDSNQTDFDFSNSVLLRNTFPYNLTKENSYYDFVIDKKEVRSSISKVKHSLTGTLDSVGVLTGGLNYFVGESVAFKNDGTGGVNASAFVSIIKGKPINVISADSRSIQNVEFYSSGPGFLIGFSTSPHDLITRTIVTVSGINTNGFYLKDNYSVGVKTDNFVLLNAVGNASVTGIVTYFSIDGNLTFPSIRENDVLGIGTEKVKVLSVDRESSRIRVLRQYDGTVSSAHTATTIVRENPRKLSFNVGFSTSSSFAINKEIYFDPKESVGVGTISGVGIGTTISFSNPGVGLTQIFIPTKTIYLPNHKLLTGDRLVYNSNGGSPLSISTDGVSSYQLTDNQVLYAARVSSDLIGIATAKVGIGSTGTFVGINSTTNQTTSFIVGVGTGVIHSFKTDYDNVLKGTVNSNVVTVSTASTHGLETGDRISLNAAPGINTTITIKYDDYNRRLVVNPRAFSATGINTITNQITISNHQYYTGQKVIHTSVSPANGLKNEEIYYVIVDDENTFKLTDSYYESLKYNPTAIDINSTSAGTISEINPKIKLRRNQVVIFDLSDSSLSYLSQSTRYSAFEFNLYTDSLFKTKFISTKLSSSFDVTKTGSIGIDADARVVLKVTDNTPSRLYYSLDPVKNLEDTTKKEIIVDSEFNQNNNLLSVELSEYFGSYSIVGVGSTTFKFNLLTRPESNYYTQNQGTFEYITNSTSAFGPIHEVSITANGRGYKSLPGITSVFTDTGSGCILEPNSNTIGKIKTIEIEDFGFDYPSDITLKPTGKLPDIIKLSPLSSFEKIGISSVGKYYTKAPSLVVIDTVRNKILNDIDLSYSLGSQEVSIKKNTYGIYDSNIRIVPINNSNGIGISSLSFDPNTKDVTIVLNESYSTGDTFPFAVGDKVIVENTSVGVASTGRGYNSENYGYSLFTLTQVNAQFGGSGAYIRYNLTNYLNVGENPGKFSATKSSGTVTPEKYFPAFTPILKKNNFLVGETVSSENYEGIVENWDPQNEYIKVSSFDDLKENQILEGKTSNSKAQIVEVKKTRVAYSTGPSIVKNDGWKSNSGFLNDDLQRVQDSDYYQNMSYSIRSKVSYDTWEEPVSTLNHTLGFKKFSDLIIESIPLPKSDDDDGFVGIKTSQDGGDFIGIADLTRTIDLNCFPDFDLATENSLKIDSNVISDLVFFKSRILQDYFESIGNRVLTIDDFSNEFNDTARTTPYSIVGTFTIGSSRFRKYVTWVRDRRFTAERQVCLFTLLQDGSTGYLNEYAKVFTVSDMGTFDFNIFGSDGQILFYPEKYEVNNFDISLISYNVQDVFSGIGTTTLGDIVKLQTTVTELPVGTASQTTIVGIASTYRASKLLVSVASTNGSYYEINELTVIHDGTNVSLLEYGRLNDSLTASSGPGLGIYDAELSGSNVNITFQPTVGLGVSFYTNVFSLSIGNTGFTGVGTHYFSTGTLHSNYKQISASASPSRSGIVSYSSDNFSGAYFIASVEDLTNNQYQVSEIVVVDDGTTANITEYGMVQTGSSIGTFDAEISSSNVEIGFTPIANADVQIRIFTNTIGPDNDAYDGSIVDLTYASVTSDAGTYSGTLNDVKRQFNLSSDGRSIFKKSFSGDLESIVSITNDTIVLPNHYFVTGEELIYTNSGSGTTSSIGIATTSITGYGTTDKLPSTVYAIKVNESTIKLAGSAENALLATPLALDITSVGIGTSHSLTGTNQNQRVIISIDNVIQAPVVSSAITTKLVSSILTTDDRLTFAGITSFFGGDLIQVDDEIMRITTIGIGSTNVVSVQRPWLGTSLKSHTSDSLITKISGNFNIVDDTISFAEAPHGLLPFSSTTNPPSERDYTGIATHSTFSGRVFMRSGLIGSTESTYSKNYVFNDISSQFTGVTTSFTLKQNGENVSGFSTNNAIVLVNQIFQQPRRSTSPIYIPGDYTLQESVGITSILFTGSISSVSYDIQSSNVPVGGVIISVGSSSGLGYQPLVAAGGTAVVSIAGTISSISIGNSGSGYRSGIQTVVNVGVATSSTGIPNIEFIGTAAISGGRIVSVAITNPGTGYTSTNPPLVVFDSPLSYSNIPLVYSSTSSGIGTEATIDIIVGQGSSVIDFEIKNLGYGYGQGQILTVRSGGSTGIPTNTAYAFEEFKILIDKTYEDSFSAWTVGDLEVLDDISDLFDGVQRAFPIKFNDEFKTIRAKKGSNIDIEATLLIFLNDILQVPGQAYRFDTGSIIEFSEAPKNGDTCKIIFYKGTGSVDVINADILETIKKGDDITLNSDNYSYQEEERTVNLVVSSDIVKTNAYGGVGISTDETSAKAVTWCRQTEDKFINGKPVAKDRTSYEPLIQPLSNIISDIGISTNAIYVESVKTFFDSSKENIQIGVNGKLRIVSQNNLVGASATAVVSGFGTISSIIISEGGVGYTTSPTVTLSNPVGLGTTQRATATSTISVGGTVSSVTIVSPGTGYTTTNPPQVLIEEPSSSLNVENVSATSFEGDFGIISGIALTSVGVASTGIVFDFYIPENSFLRNASIVGTAITISGIQTGYYFVITESNVGNGVTTLDADSSIVGVGTSFLDNVYRVASVSIGTTDVVGVGLTYTSKVVVSVNSYNGLSGIGYSNYYGRFSWGKINVSARSSAKEFSSYNNNGITGLSTSPIVERINPLKYFNYN